MNIIIFGEMGAGKSTVASYLVYKYGYKRVSLGAKIHSECKLHGNETREEMQQYGQMMRKIFGENTWCNYLYFKNVNEKKLVIDDARQPNEFNYFTNKGFLPIAVVADDETRLERLQRRVNYKIDPKTFNHETEVNARICVGKCDIKIYNNSNNENLYKEIENKLEKYLWR